MPVNKQIGKLWFDTQEEIDRYDDLMVSNIELKEGSNSDDPNYTFISPRSKKEIMPTQMSDLYLKTYQQYLNTKPLENIEKFSNTYFHELNLLKYIAGTIAGYFIMRELPIRNFYARSSLMFVYLCGLRDNFQFSGITKNINTNIVLLENENIKKQYQVYKNVREATTEIQVEKTGITPEKKWRWSQPGFIDVKYPTDATKLKFYNSKYNKDAFWDGTFNQPTIPLADRMHKDSANFW